MYHRFTPYCFLAVPLLLMALFFVLPFLLTVGMSTLDYSQDLYTPSFVGLNNYATTLHSPDFWKAFQNTFLILLGVVPAMVALPIGLAVLVNTPIKGIAFFRGLIYLPVIVSMVVVGIAWKWLYANDGLLNALLVKLGFEKVGWLVNPDIALWAVMIVVIWKGLAYYMMMYLAHLQSVSKDLYESAELDGASQLQRHWHITLPHLQPTMIMVAMISTIGCLKIFAEVYVMTGGGPVGSTQTLVYYIYERAFENLDLGVASAAGILVMGILLVMSILQLRASGYAGASS